MNSFREDSHRRVKQRKTEIEQKEEQQRKQSLTKIKQQVIQFHLD